MYGWADLLFIFLSIATMLVETIPEIHARSDEAGSTEGTVFFSIETLTVVFFTFDVILRLVVVPDRWDFVRSPATLLDILTVAPYYIEFFLPKSRLESMKVCPQSTPQYKYIIMTVSRLNYDLTRVS